jgi:hypothetical protein
MASRWTGRIILKSLDDSIVPKMYDLGVIDDTDLETEFGLAATRLAAILAELDPVTELTIIESTLTYRLPTGNSAGAGSAYQEAIVNVYTLDEDDPTAVTHISQLSIPSPVIGIFAGTSGAAMNQVDTSDSDLQAYATVLHDAALISDGETVQAQLPNAGIVSGRRNIRTRKLNS